MSRIRRRCTFSNDGSIADGNGNGITANAGNGGDGVETTVDGTGSALYAWTPTFSNGRAARLVNYNDANTNPVLTVEQHSTGNVALFKRGDPSTVNVARIDGTGMTLNASNGADREAAGPALALAGRVPVKVTSEGGAIRTGDLLVASSTPGYAMRAPADPAVGTVVGKALERADRAKGSIKMLVMAR